MSRRSQKQSKTQKQNVASKILINTFSSDIINVLITS